MRKLVVLLSSAALYVAPAIWAQSSTTTPDQSSTSQDQSSTSTDQNKPGSSTTSQGSSTNPSSSTSSMTSSSPSSSSAEPGTYSGTLTLGLLTPDGKFYRLDQASLSKLQTAVRAHSSANSSNTSSTTGPDASNASSTMSSGWGTDQKVTIQGRLQGDTLTVESVEVK
jgi:hypothetical protein